MKIARIILAILLLTSFAHARGFMTGVGSGSGSPPPIIGGLMLEDTTSFILLEDATSHFCLEGGC